MADEEVVDEAAGEKKSGGKLGLILMVVGLLVAVGGGLGVYFFVIAPQLSGEEVVEDDPMEYDDIIPLNPGYVTFDQSFTNLIKDQNDDGPASTLLYQVKLECSDQLTADLIDGYKARFVDMVGKAHDSRTRAEVDDILLFKESVQRQIKQKSNDLLKRIVQDPGSGIKEKEWPNYRITAVFHEKCFPSDPQ